MFRKIGTPLLIVGGFLVLFIGLFSFMQTADLSMEDLSGVDFKRDWLGYRVTGYILILLFWKPISRYISRPRMYPEDRTEEINQKWDELSEILFRSWWKVALFFAAFEIIIIQQGGVFFLDSIGAFINYLGA